MSKQAIGQAVRLFQSFRERKPQRVGVVKFRVPKAVACMGYVEGIDYRTTHGKKITLYHHDFAPGARPFLAVSSDGLQLLLLGGRFKFTHQGIVDKDARGRLITNPKHGKNVNPSRRKKKAKCIPVKVRAKQLRREAAQHVKDARKLERKPKRRRNPKVMDPATAAHFKVWANKNRVPSEVQQTMRILYANDPDYWTERGWPALEAAVRALK